MHLSTLSKVSSVNLDYYLSKHPELKALYDLAQSDYSARGLVHHNWNHVLRVLAEGIELGEPEKANMKIALAGLLLHDIGRLHVKEGEDHHAAGARIAPGILRKAGFIDNEIEDVVHCICSHGPRGLEEPSTLEAKVCYDVDVLSCSCGNLGVARVFHFFIAEQEFTIKQMMEVGSGKKGPRKSFYTKTGRQRGLEGFQKAARFWTELRKELKKEEHAVKKIVPEYKGD
jgi:HD superfamily phosphodiesterase